MAAILTSVATGDRSGESIVVHRNRTRRQGGRVIEKLLNEWLDSFDDPDRPVMQVPDERSGLLSPRQVVEEIRSNTQLGKGWLRSIRKELAGSR